MFFIQLQPFTPFRILDRKTRPLRDLGLKFPILGLGSAPLP